MENIRFRNSRIINWIRYHGTPGMQAKFAATTKDPAKLAILAFSKKLIVVGAVAGNTHTPESTLEDLSNYDHFRNYFDYQEYEKMVLTPLAGNITAHPFTIGKLSYIHNLYEVVANNPRIIKIVDYARQSDSRAFLAELSSCPILHVRQAIKQNKHTPDFVRERLTEDNDPQGSLFS